MLLRPSRSRLSRAFFSASPGGKRKAFTIRTGRTGRTPWYHDA
jgi:hypothetical protein